MASLYNWGPGGYSTNEWFLGTITDNNLTVEDRGLLDYGQYYAAHTGSNVQVPNGRRVLFPATGWHKPMASTIKQSAPLAGGAESDNNEVELVLLVDRGLVEFFLNRRAVISSFVNEIMAETNPSPAERAVLVAEAPSGVTCAFVSYEWTKSPRAVAC